MKTELVLLDFAKRFEESRISIKLRLLLAFILVVVGLLLLLFVAQKTRLPQTDEGKGSKALALDQNQEPQRLREGNTMITAQEAIRLAEDFIVQNGFTDLPAMGDKTKLFVELTDPSDPDEVLRMRHDTLEPEAYKVLPRDDSDPGWTVVFRYNSNNEKSRELIADLEQWSKKYGRAVVMDMYGNHLRIVHQEISID